MIDFRYFEKLVNYAIGGTMHRDEVSSTVAKLKAEKAEIMNCLAALPDGTERRDAFRKLHSLTYRLYDAKVYVGKDKDNDKYASASSMANMILCYDCK